MKGGPVNGTTTTQADVIRDLNASCVVFVDGGNTYALQYFLARAATRDVTWAAGVRCKMSTDLQMLVSIQPKISPKGLVRRGLYLVK